MIMFDKVSGCYKVVKGAALTSITKVRGILVSHI